MSKFFYGSSQNLLDLGAKVILEPPETFNKLPEAKALICMVNNPEIDIIWCENKRILEALTHPQDRRFKVWFLLDKYTAEEHFV